MKYKIIMQHDENDCGAACLAMICETYGMKMPLVKYRDMLHFNSNGTSVYDIVCAAKRMGFDTVAMNGGFENLMSSLIRKEIELPCIAVTNKEGLLHYVVIYKVDKKYITIADPGEGLCKLPFEEFKKIYCDSVIEFKKTEAFRPITNKGVTIEVIKELFSKNKKMIWGVLLLSVMITVVSLLGNLGLEKIISNSYSYAGVEIHTDTEEHAGHQHEENGHSILTQPRNLVLIVLVLAAVKLAIELVRSIMISKWTSNNEYEFLESFYKKVLNAPLSVLKSRKTGDLLARFSDIRKMNGYIIEIVTTLSLNITFFVGFGFALIILCRSLFLVTLLVGVLYGLIICFYQKRIIKNSYKLLQKNSEMVSNLEESIKGICLIKNNNISDRREKSFQGVLLKYTDALGRVSKLSYQQNNFVSFINTGSSIITIYLGIDFCIKGIVPIHTLILYLLISTYFMPAIANLFKLQPKFAEMSTVYRRIEDIYELPEDAVGGCEIECINDIEISNMSYGYSSNNLVVDNINLKINKGDKIVISGKNGSGKSTLANIIVGNYAPMDGQIKYNGISGVNPKSVKEYITYVEQDTYMFHDTIFSNIAMGSMDIERFEKICKLTKVNEFIDTLPNGYFTILEENGNNISTGQKQKLALARALMRDTPIYIFDEITSNLDSMTKREICDLFSKEYKDKTMIFITHDECVEELGQIEYSFANGKLYKVRG